MALTSTSHTAPAPLPQALRSREANTQRRPMFGHPEPEAMPGGSNRRLGRDDPRVMPAPELGISGWTKETAMTAPKQGVRTPTVTVAIYLDYASAQRAVDHLSDNGFPVDQTAIVGTDLRLVERVLGRMTTGRAALAGAASGAWFGLFIGLLLALFTTRGWLLVVLTGLLIGAVWGAAFGAIAHAMTAGRRDFTSWSQLVAEQYAVTVTAEHADRARQMLGQLTFPSPADLADRTIPQEPATGRVPIQQRLRTGPGKRLSGLVDRARRSVADRESPR
jgi:hypothetical protein